MRVVDLPKVMETFRHRDDVSAETPEGLESGGPVTWTIPWGGRPASPPPSTDTGAVTGPTETEDSSKLLDRLEDLEDEITHLAAHLHAGTHRLLTLLAEFDRRGGWKAGGHRNCADWLHFRTGYCRNVSREKVRTARALEGMPRTGEAMARGELSYSKVRCLTRVADDLARNPDPDAESDLVAYATGCTTAELERFVRAWRVLGRADEADLERRRHASRTLSIAPDGEGMFRVQGRLDPEVGAVLLRAIDAAADALHRTGVDWAAEGGTRGPRAVETTPGQRRADAIGLLAERALGAGFGDGGPAPVPDVSAETFVPAHVALPEPVSGTRAERYQVFLHVEAPTLREEGEPGRAHLEDGTRLSSETCRRFTCDGSVVRVDRAPPSGPLLSPAEARPGTGTGKHSTAFSGNGTVLDVGRRTRTVPAALRRALEVRDGGCRFPGCGLRFTEAHHVRHWADGGETRISNLVLLCRRHHRAVHEDGFRVRLLADGRIRFFDRTGWPLPDAPPPLPASPVTPERRPSTESLLRMQTMGGFRPRVDAPTARYRRRSDIPWRLEARAWEALDPP